MPLQLPALFHGKYRDVKPRLTKLLTRVRRQGAPWMDLVTEAGLLDVATTPGYLVLDGPSPLLGGEEHFQVWLLWYLMHEPRWEIPREEQDRVFRDSLTVPWGTLGLTAHPSQFWFRDPARYRPFLSAAVEYWDDFVAVGDRYTAGSRHPVALWQLPNCILKVLGRMGMPGPYPIPMPPGGLAELIAQHDIHLGNGHAAP